MTPEQREELKQAASAASPGPWEYAGENYGDHGGKYREVTSESGTIVGEYGGPSIEDAKYMALADPAAILSLIAQVEALTVPQVYVVEADYGHDGSQPVRAFHGKVDAETFTDALNDYQQSEPRTSWENAEYKAWMAAHPVPEFKAADEFVISEVPLGLPTIPAIPGTKEGAQ